jgi:hypothetical protein
MHPNAFVPISVVPFSIWLNTLTSFKSNAFLSFFFLLLFGLCTHSTCWTVASTVELNDEYCHRISSMNDISVHCSYESPRRTIAVCYLVDLLFSAHCCHDYRTKNNVNTIDRIRRWFWEKNIPMSIIVDTYEKLKHIEIARKTHEDVVIWEKKRITKQANKHQEKGRIYWLADKADGCWDNVRLNVVLWTQLKKNIIDQNYRNQRVRFVYSSMQLLTETDRQFVVELVALEIEVRRKTTTINMLNNTVEQIATYIFSDHSILAYTSRISEHKLQ